MVYASAGDQESPWGMQAMENAVIDQCLPEGDAVQGRSIQIFTRRDEGGFQVFATVSELHAGSFCSCDFPIHWHQGLTVCAFLRAEQIDARICGV